MDLRGPVKVVSIIVATVLVAAGLLVLARFLDRSVVDEAGCRIGPNTGRLLMDTGDKTFLTVPLPRARKAPARIVDIRSIGSINPARLTYSAGPSDVLGTLRSRSTLSAALRKRLRPVNRVVLTSTEQDLLADPDASRDRAPWTLVVGIEAKERGIFSLAALDITYRSGKKRSSCHHDLSVAVLVGEHTPDIARQAPVYLGVGYAHTLGTHCGILSAQFGGLQWIADPPLQDGSGNPPPLWSNPSESGSMRLVEPDRAVFKTKDDLRAAFRPRAPGDPPLPSCM